MRIVCCAQKASLAAYIEQRTDQQVVFAIGGQRCRLATPIVAAHDVFYFHWEEQDGEILNVIVDTYHRVEFSGCEPRDLRTMSPPHRGPRWICSQESGQIWQEQLPDPLEGLVSPDENPARSRVSGVRSQSEVDLSRRQGAVRSIDCFRERTESGDISSRGH